MKTAGNKMTFEHKKFNFGQEYTVEAVTADKDYHSFFVKNEQRIRPQECVRVVDIKSNQPVS